MPLPAVATIPARTFLPPAEAPAPGTVSTLELEVDGRITVTGLTPMASEGVDLGAATRLVAVGRGFRKQEDLGLARDLLGLAPAKVRVHVTLLGGGFGRRLHSDYALEAAELSRAVKGPVQVVWSREDDLAHAHYHPMSLHRMEAGLEGARLKAWTHRVAAPSILLSWSEGKRSPDLVEAETNGAMDFPYGVPNLQVEYQEAACHVPLGWWRAIEAMPNVFARECFLDETAHAAGKDPFQWRRELLGEARTLELGEMKVETGRLRRVLELAAEKAGWGRPMPPGQGRGIACSAYDGRTYVAMVAEVEVTPKGGWRVLKVVAAADCGLVVNPLGAAGQVESGIVWGLSALRTRIGFKDGRVEQTSFADLPVWQMADGTAMEVHFVPSEASPTGLGEPPVPLVIPAVLNAVFAATGKRIRRLPLELVCSRPSSSPRGLPGAWAAPSSWSGSGARPSCAGPWPPPPPAPRCWWSPAAGPRR